MYDSEGGALAPAFRIGGQHGDEQCSEFIPDILQFTRSQGDERASCAELVGSGDPRRLRHHLRTDRALLCRARRSCRSSCSSPPTCWSTASSASSRRCGRRASNERWGLLVLEGIADIAVGVIAFLWPGLTVFAFVLMMAAWSTRHRRPDDRGRLQAQPDLRARLADLQRHRLGAVRHRARRGAADRRASC